MSLWDVLLGYAREFDRGATDNTFVVPVYSFIDGIVSFVLVGFWMETISQVRKKMKFQDDYEQAKQFVEGLKEVRE